MHFGELIPIVLFICIAWTIKAVVDARLRARIIDSNGSQELVRSMIEGDEVRRRHESLRRGIILLALGIGFAAVNANGGFDEFTPMSLAILLGATGLGNLAYYLLARKVA
ncbi:MAG: hypothetical protein HOQ02_07975 [Lysobacter sp.]|nr:hypothetical protein [Lysobacter sp.]